MMETMEDGTDLVKVESLVQDFLSAQSLKVLPQGPLGEAVNQFVTKDDKHAMELFVSEHLSGQVRQMLGLESDDEDLNSAMEIYRKRMELQLQSGARRAGAERQRVLKPQPAHWDPDFDGNWEDAPDAWTYSEEPASAASRRSGGNTAFLDDEDEDSQPVAPKRTTSRATKAAPKKAAPKKAATTRGRGKNAAVQDSDDEDVVMDSDEEEAPPPKTTRRAAAKPKAAPKKTAATRASGRTKQTTLTFSQKGNTQDNSLEISDDEISDDDAFDPPPPTTRSTRRR